MHQERFPHELSTEERRNGMEKDLQRLIIERLKPDKTALIVVDVQNDFCHPEGGVSKRGINLSQIEKAAVNLIYFTDHCRKADLPIIFVRTVHSDWTDSPSWLGRLGGMTKETPVCRMNSWGAEFYKIEPRENDFIVVKHRYSGFVGTDLDLVLRSKGIETLLISGVATNVCVETTARDGFNLNYNVLLVEDCCGAFSPDEHASALRNLGSYFGIVTDSKTLLEVLKGLRKV